jgi:hypothetical protein
MPDAPEPCCDDAISDAEVRARALEELAAWMAAPAPGARDDVTLATMTALGSGRLAARLFARHAAAASLGEIVELVRAMAERAQDARDAEDVQYASIVAAAPPLVRAGERLVFVIQQACRAPAETPPEVVEALAFATTSNEPNDQSADEELAADAIWAHTRALRGVEEVLRALDPEVPGVSGSVADRLSAWDPKSLADARAMTSRALRVAHTALKYGRTRGRMQPRPEAFDAQLADVNAAVYELSYAVEQVPGVEQLRGALASLGSSAGLR